MEQTARVAAIQRALGVRGIEVLGALLLAGLPSDVLDPLLIHHVWTAEKPTKPGWYFIRNVRWADAGEIILLPDIVFIFESIGRLGFDMETAGEVGWVGLTEVDAEFSGPLEPPR